MGLVHHVNFCHKGPCHVFSNIVGKHCIGLHARLETPLVRAQKAQMPMGADMVVDSYVMKPPHSYRMGNSSC